MTSYTAALVSVQTTETLAEQADAAITAALSDAADVPALTADAADALARARTIADNSTATPINVPRLRDDIAAANASAHAQLATWRRDVVAGVSALRQRAGGVEHEATGRATLTRAHVTARIVDAAQATAVRIAREQDDGGALTRMERIVDAAGEASADVVQRIMSLDEAATSLGARATRVVATVARASETLQHDDDAATTIIEKMRSIERKLSRVVSTAAALKRPTLLDSGATALQFNIVHRSPVHNQVALEFRAENISFDALLYFAEERQGGGAIYLQLISGRLHLGFHAREGATVNVTSEAQLCSHCWLHVHATRFADKAFLTVVDLQTGRQTTGYAQTDDASVRNVTITSPAYVGGLPANYVTNKPVTAERFVGCLFQLEVDDQPVSLHRSVTPPPTDPTRCCVAPPMRQRDDAWNVRCDDQDCSQAVRFTGIHSYLQMEPQDIEVGNRSEFLFDFTTHSSNAPLVIVRSDNGAEYLLSLTAGRVSLSISKPNATTLRMRTRGASYGDGSFYQLHARHNSSVASLRLSYLNATSSAVVEDLHAAVRGRLARFPALPRFFLGGDGSSGGASFAGCMRHFYHGTAFRGVTPRDLDALVVASAGVSRHCAHPTVVGVSFRGDGSYAQMNVSSGVTLADLYSSRVTFKTRAPSGVALFATDADGNALYVALYNGDVFIQIVVAWTQLLQPIRTAGLGLDDGRWHTVQFDAGDAIPALMVDGVRYIHTRPVQLPRGPAVEVYLGGTPVRVIKQRELPVTRSYRGDVTSMSVNGNRIDLADPETVLESEGVAIDAVLPAADSAPPADKFVAIVSSECEPVELSNITVPGLRFGRERGSHAVFSVRGFGSDPLRSMLVLTMRFRSLAPSGVLMYAASSLRIPRDYMCLYLQEGRLVFSMQTSPRDRRTERLASNKKYADGNQWEVNVVRMNNFVAMVVTEARDYVNNGLDSERDASSLVQPDLYIGGVPTSARTPSLLADVPALQGCVMQVTVGTTERTRALQLQDPVTSSGTAACAASERAGLSFGGAGYAVVSSRFTLGASLSFTLVLHAHNASALLLYAATSPTDFLVVDINATTARLLLSNGARDAYETTVGLRGGPLCDAREHTVTADMNTRSVTLSVDGLAEETTFNNGFSLVTLASRLYLGGAPPGGGGVTGDRLPNAEAPDFSGCVKRMVLNGNDVALHELRRENVDYGCVDPAADTR
ncbi:PREDICTED: laminin subunit alpha-1-like [Priapulus caudatus]|uniref:Laminin subunit alpha-1-like n=1 Tax=Priapulus caudatus TaxID=37621 RepID=A0ABM1DRH7_PRICU|nr:PREDICTED: laminin subunit alpha-1-like [Priapulus caudatus]